MKASPFLSLSISSLRWQKVSGREAQTKEMPHYRRAKIESDDGKYFWRNMMLPDKLVKNVR
jgi:hypothetical protein